MGFKSFKSLSHANHQGSTKHTAIINIALQLYNLLKTTSNFTRYLIMDCIQQTSEQTFIKPTNLKINLKAKSQARGKNDRIWNPILTNLSNGNFSVAQNFKEIQGYKDLRTLEQFYKDKIQKVIMVRSFRYEKDKRCICICQRLIS